MDKQQEIIENLLKEAEKWGYGEIVIKFKIGQNKIVGAEMILQQCVKKLC